MSPGFAIIPADERPLSYRVIQNLCTLMTGVQAVELPVEIESEADNIKVYAFTYSNGDRLLAVWTDGAAAEDDSYTNVTLTIPNFWT